MKITDVKTILLTGPSTLDPFLTNAVKYRSVAIIKIETDSGLTGLGETYGGYFFPEGVPEVVEFFKPILVGNGVEDIPELWRRMYHCGNFWCRVGYGAIVLAGIEAALWDLKGKALGLPVYKLLGEAWKNEFPQTATAKTFTTHERLPCYASGGPSNFPMDRLAAKVEYYLSLGYRGVKLGAGAFYENERRFEIPAEPAAAAELESKKAAMVRERFGKKDDLWLMFDAHMGNSPVTWDYDTALAVSKALEPFDLFFFEEALHYTRPDWYADLRRNTNLPIAGGECLTSVSEWQIYLEKDSFDIGQPDASFVSGLDQFMKVASLLAKKGRSVITHSWGAGAGLMQNMHCGFACPNTTMLEMTQNYGPLHSEMIGDSLQMKDGYILPPEKPGLGIELREETIKRFPFVRGMGEFNSVPGKIYNT